MIARYPRLVIAGTGGDSGKTLVSLAVARAALAAGHDTMAFKKGPDYIDAAWLSWAAGRTARNLDTHLMGETVVRGSFLRHGSSNGINVIEGNRGLFDGMDAAGTHSTGFLAKALQAPVVLVVPVTKVTASVAAVVHGFATLDNDITVAGVVLNRVGSARQERVIRYAVTLRAGIRVLGSIPRLGGPEFLPERHLGLVPLHERNDLERVCKALDEVAGHLDMDGLFDLACSAPTQDADSPQETVTQSFVRVGVFRDPAFSFYYPDNLEALESAGAELVFLSPLTDPELPELDALYIGGGFPETHADRLSSNQSMLASVRKAAHDGLPIYAECGGLMYLSRSIGWQGRSFPMAGVLDVDAEIMDRPQGHGYAEAMVDRANPFYEKGARFRGHEFHYSAVRPTGASPDLSLKVLRGHGCLEGRCGLVKSNVFATYIHVHALGEPEWAGAVIRAASRRL